MKTFDLSEARGPWAGGHSSSRERVGCVLQPSANSGIALAANKIERAVSKQSAVSYTWRALIGVQSEVSWNAVRVALEGAEGRGPLPLSVEPRDKRRCQRSSGSSGCEQPRSGPRSAAAPSAVNDGVATHWGNPRSGHSRRLAARWTTLRNGRFATQDS
jgi:hypothetical protein